MRRFLTGGAAVAMGRTLKLGAMSAINIGATLVFQWLILTMLGPGTASDALFAALTVPQIFASVIGVSLTSVLTPLLAGEPEAEQHLDTWTLLVLCTTLFVALSAVLIVAAPWWIPLTVPGFTSAGQALTVRLGMIALVGMVFTGTNAVQAAAAFARERYLWVDAAPALASVVAVALLPLLMPHYGVYAAAALATGRLALQTALMMRGMGAPARPRFDRPILRLAWRRLAPLLAGASYYKMDPLVDRFLLSALAPGSLSLFYLAQQLWSAAGQVLAKALAVPAITRLAVAAKSSDRARFARDLGRTLALVVGVGSLAWLGAMIVGRPLLGMVLTTGRFGGDDSHTLWWLLVLSGGMLIGGSGGTLLAGAFYAVGDTRTPTVMGTLSFTAAIGLKVALFWWLGIGGLAFAVSLYYLLSLFILLAGLIRRGLLSRRAAEVDRS